MPGSTARPWVPFLVALVTVGLPRPIEAQALPTLVPSDYGRWETLLSAQLDPTGRHVLVAIRTTDGDAELRIHPFDGSGSAHVLPRGARPAFTPDGNTLVYVREGDDEADDDSPEARSRLGVLRLDEGTDTVLSEARTFALSGDGRWVASLAPAPSDSVGADLTLREIATGRQFTLGNVGSFAWRDDGALLAASLRTASGSGNGVTLFDPDDGILRSLDSSPSTYGTPTWREDAGDLAVLRSVDASDREDPGHDVLLWRTQAGEVPSGPPRVLSALGRLDLPDSLRVPATSPITWAEGGGVVFVGLRPWVASPQPADSTSRAANDDEDPGPSPVQVWHWNDDRILRAQESSAAADARRTFLAAWHLDGDRLVRLGLELDEPVRLTADGRWGVVDDVDPYAFARRFGASTRDAYRVDVGTGERTLIAEGLESGVVLGPEGRRALLHDGEAWWAVEMASLGRTRIGEGVAVEFVRPLDEYDYPGPRPPWGVGAWSSDESRAWIHDEHDVWEADLSSGTLRRRTPGAEDGRRYRVLDLGPDASAFDLTASGLDPAEPLWVTISDPRSWASGYGRTNVAGGVDPLLLEDAQVSRLARAEDAERYLLVRERFDDSPDVFVGSASLDDLRQVGATNPFQPEYAWGRSELLDYTTDAGHELHAILTYPADYDPSRTYPLILYQYERLSQNLHRYVPPSRTSYYNVQVWSQQGYFVLQPDIVYEPGRPGPSALDAIGHALDAALEAAPIDPDRMGLVGHSWGGYQAAYVPTRMHRFAASVAGAAITNFLSFPGTVHWNGGLPELGHWETGQARMALPPWEDLDGHLESSPVAAIHELRTPVLLMHGDADGVVDFRQGLEFYNYARRLGKEVVLLVYPDADHGLRREENQVDYQDRILDWFGHFLKGEPAPRWITEGEDWDARRTRMGNGSGR